MSFNHGALVICGSGPGVARSIATLFAERGFQKVVLMSRNAERLSEDAQLVRAKSAAVTVYEVPADFGDQDQVREGLRRTELALGETPLDCVLYNAAKTAKSAILEYSSDAFRTDLQIGITGLYEVAQWAIPRLKQAASLDEHTPSLLVTSGMLAKDPYPAMFSLAASKAGQYSVVHSLHKQFEPQGVHCSLIIIAGSVSDSSAGTNPRNIAQEAWKVYRQPKFAGSLEIVVDDPAFSDHVKNREK